MRCVISVNSSKELFPYEDSAMKIVFSDSIGNEVIGYTGLVDVVGLSSTIDEVQCQNNSEQNLKVRAQYKKLKEFISIPALNIGFEVEFSVFPNLEKYEEKQVTDFANILFVNTSSYLYSLGYPIPQIAILLNIRNDSKEPSHEDKPVAFFSINGKEYQNVYTNIIGRDIIEFYYNHQFGIIGFKQKSTGILYGFERIE